MSYIKGRTAETIQAEIDALQAELANAHPSELTIASDSETRTLGVSLADFAGCLRLESRVLEPLSFHSEGVCIQYLTPAKAGQLRDWLNYHFPKETI